MLAGRGGDDSLYGRAGADSLEGGAGADLLDGGDGHDWALYSASDAGVTIDLAAGTAKGGHAEGDTLTGIENVAGSDYGDTLVGDGWRVAQRKLEALDVAARLDDLRIPAGNRLERLKGTRSCQHSMRINDQYRVIFRWENGHAYADVGIEDCH